MTIENVFFLSKIVFALLHLPNVRTHVYVRQKFYVCKSQGNCARLPPMLPLRSFYHPRCTRVIFYKCRWAHMRPVRIRAQIIKIADCARIAVFFFFSFTPSRCYSFHSSLPLSARRKFYACKFLGETRGMRYWDALFLFRNKFYSRRKRHAISRILQILSRALVASGKYWLQRDADVSKRKGWFPVKNYQPRMAAAAYFSRCKKKSRVEIHARKCYGVKLLLSEV